jgi:hypothetical protein
MPQAEHVHEAIQKKEEAQEISVSTLSSLVLGGDLSKLTEKQRLEYYVHRAKAAGLDPGCKPFDLINLSGRLVLYATKECANQLTSNRHLSVNVIARETVDGVHVVTARVTGDARVTDDIGAVALGSLKGDMLANALMKCVTKAKRRAVLSHCGLGMIDESELETVRDVAVQPMAAKPSRMPQDASEPKMVAKSHPEPEVVAEGRLEAPAPSVTITPPMLPEEEGDKISRAQVVRWHAIRNEFGVGTEAGKAILADMGYTSSADIEVERYEDACERLRQSQAQVEAGKALRGEPPVDPNPRPVNGFLVKKIDQLMKLVGLQAVHLRFWVSRPVQATKDLTQAEGERVWSILDKAKNGDQASSDSITAAIEFMPF